MLVLSGEPIAVVRVGESPWQDGGEEGSWYRVVEPRVVVSKNATPCKGCHLAPAVVVRHLEAHL